MQNGHHTPMLCSRLVELVRPGRCASRNQAEVRAALHLEVVWYEATWFRWHYPVAQQNWRDQHGSTWFNTSPMKWKSASLGAQLIMARCQHPPHRNQPFAESGHAQHRTRRRPLLKSRDGSCTSTKSTRIFDSKPGNRKTLTNISHIQPNQTKSHQIPIQPLVENLTAPKSLLPEWLPWKVIKRSRWSLGRFCLFMAWSRAWSVCPGMRISWQQHWQASSRIFFRIRAGAKCLAYAGHILMTINWHMTSRRMNISERRCRLYKFNQSIYIYKTNLYHDLWPVNKIEGKKQQMTRRMCPKIGNNNPFTQKPNHVPANFHDHKLKANSS